MKNRIKQVSTNDYSIESEKQRFGWEPRGHRHPIIGKTRCRKPESRTFLGIFGLSLPCVQGAGQNGGGEEGQHQSVQHQRNAHPVGVELNRDRRYGRVR